ncbi:type VII secretion protein EccB [Kitasatospora sp. NPDC094015]|uniref:type VII secretion protein EccB n=1 Tax=Kitasatospora sp. NPDC094015 TaxID=3155205 RepID=UPI00332179AE
MQTRRDHVQAYQFAMGRLATALVSGDPGRGESPTRRAALGTFLGAGVTALLCAGSGVYGLISPVPSAAWRTPGAIVLERQTGNRYLLLDGELRPVRNRASALLLAGSTAPMETADRAALAGAPHGAPIGIPGAPDTVPTGTGLLTGGWTRCLRPDLATGQSVDFAPQGRTTPVPADRQALLAGPDGKRYLLFGGVRYPVPSDSVLIALGLDGEQAVPARPSWLAALPQGAPLAAPTVPDAGAPAGQVAGAAVTVGQLFSTDSGGTDRYYLMRSDGIAPVNASEAALLAMAPGAPAVRRVGATDMASTPLSTAPPPADRLPDVRDAPPIAAAGQALCLAQTPDGTAVRSRVVLEGGAAATGTRPVLVPADSGVYAVDQTQLAAQALAPRSYLIDDQGTAYPLGEGSAAAQLGLAGRPRTPVPGDLLAELPQGPVLDVAAARATAGGR